MTRKVSLVFCLLLLAAAPAAFAATQSIPSTTGLDRIDQRRLPLDHGYTYNETGANSIIYIVDTGANPVAELSGRLERRSFFGSRPWTGCVASSFLADDPGELGHGTQVATIAAGTVHGVAKQAQVVSIKAVGDSSNYPIVCALQNIHATHPAGVPGVVNMSFIISNEDQKQAIKNAVDTLINDGLMVVAVVRDKPLSCDAADPEATLGTGTGNAALGGAIAVGSLSLDDGSPNATGPCVDIFAPNSNLAQHGSGTEVVFPGVSGSAPLVSGVLALLQQRLPSIARNPAELESELKRSSTKGVINVSSDPTIATTTALLHSLPRAGITMQSGANVGETFNAITNSIAGATYVWRVSNGTVVAGGSTATPTIRAGCGGVLNVDVTIDAPTGRSTGMAAMTVIQPSSSLSASDSTYINPGGSATLRVDLSGPAPWTLSWSDGVQQTVTSTPAFRTVSPAQTTTYTVVASTNGCPATPYGSVTITVTDCIPANATIYVPSSAYSSTWLTASVPPEEGASYQWEIDNGFANWMGDSPSLYFRTGCSGTTNLRVTITRSCGIQSTGTASVTNQPSTADAWGSTTIASGQSATIQANYTGSRPWSITWSDGVRQTNIGKTWVTRTVTPTSTRTYTITDVRDAGNCPGTATGSATITVY